MNRIHLPQAQGVVPLGLPPVPTPLDGHGVRRLRNQDQLLLARAAAAIEQDRRRNVYLATVAHELRNALAPIANALEILAVRATDPRIVGDIVPMARRQLRQMAALTADLLDLGRAVNDEFHLKLERVPVQEAVAGVVAACRMLTEVRQQTLAVDMPATPLHVWIDRMRFSQALQNVIGNAVKFTPARGRIAVRVYQARDMVGICVTDNGIGIAADDIEHIFELFYRGRGTAEGGVGIGLALARRLVELQGGTIVANSPGPGEGATLTLSLPLAVQFAAA